jgi:hypothetical protein
MILKYRTILGLALLAFSFQIQASGATPASCGTTPKPTAIKSPTVPWDQIGVQAADKYHGDGLTISPMSEGARLHCTFQRLDGEVTPHGLGLISTSTNQTSDRFQSRAVSVGRAATALSLADTGAVKLNPTTVRFERAGLVEEYGVSMDGIRQDFIVTSKPPGVGQLTVGLAVTGARVQATAYGAQLRLDHSGRKIAYRRLQVTDATGRLLPARFEVRLGESTTALAVVADDAGAVYPVRIDPTFSDANWVSMGNFSAVNGTIQAMAVDDAGNLYIGGTFTMAGGITANSIAEWNGGSWSALGSGISGSVLGLAVSGTNLYVGGWFTSAGGVAAANIALWNGSQWSALGAGIPTQNGLNVLAVQGTNLYAGGSFFNAGGVAANSIAQWDGTRWSALGSGVDGIVMALAVSGTNLYVGGNFDNAGGVASNSIAQWNGENWSNLGSGISRGADVFALTVSGSNLYAGGFFNTAGGVNANSIAVWNGSNWSALGQGIIDGDLNGPAVFALAVSGSNLYAAGDFWTAGNVPANCIAQWNGTSWSALGEGLGGSNEYGGPEAYALAVSGNRLYVGGFFTSVDSLATTNVAEWTGTSWSTINPLASGWLSALTVSETNLYAGGTFVKADGNPVSCILQWNGDGWAPLSQGINGWLFALAASGTNLYAGGSFSSLSGVNAHSIAQWNGNYWSALGSGIDHYVYALAPTGNTLYAGGLFTSAGGVVCHGIAEWNGSNWSALGSGVGYGNVNALAVSGTNLFAGGYFSSAGGAAASSIAEWNGSNWSPLGTGIQGASSTVDALAIAGTNLFAGGDFTNAGGAAANFIAQWNGKSWSPLGSGFNGEVNALVLFGTNLYAGGDFTTAGGAEANHLALWNGGNWTALGPGMNDNVWALVAAEGTLYAGGDFTMAGETPAAYAAAAALVPPEFQSEAEAYTAETITLNLWTAANLPSRLYASTNLNPPIDWQPLYTNATGGAWQFTDTNINGTPLKFYRASTP